MHRTSCVAILVAVAVLLPGCSSLPGENEAISASVRQLVNDAVNGEVIDISEAVGMAWDRIQVLRPDSINDEANELLGTRWAVEQTGGGFFDHDFRIVVLDEGQVVAWARLSEDDVGICDSALSISADDPRVAVIVAADERRYLVTPDVEIPEAASGREVCGVST
jgi:hypothetical protein